MNSRPTIWNGVRSTLTPLAPTPVAVEPLTWERIYPLLPPDLQARLLQPHSPQPPTILDALPANRTDSFLNRWLRSDPDQLPTISLQRLDQSDLTPWESQAVSAAAGAEELFLIDAEAGPTQWKLAVALARQRLGATQRCLILTGSASEADEILQRLSPGMPRWALARAVGPMEDLSRLPAASQGRTTLAHGQQLLATAQQRLRQQLDQLRHARQSYEAAHTYWEQSLTWQARLESLQAELRVQEGELAKASESPRLAELRREQATLESRRSQLQQQRDRQQAELTRAEAELQQAKAGKAGLGGLLKSFFGSTPNLAQLTSQVQTLEASVKQLSQELADVERRGSPLLQEQAATQAEAESQQLQLRQRVAQLQQQQTQLQQSIHDARAELTQIGCDDATALAESARRCDMELSLAEAWAEQLNAAPPSLLATMLQVPQVVIGPFAAYGADPLTTGASGFSDILILAAEHRDEAELQSLISTGRRTVLVADLSAILRGLAAAARPSLPSSSSKTPVPSSTPRGLPFRKLWQHLHHDRWNEEDGCLIAQLVKVEGLDRAALLREPLADRPEIEIRFLKLPTGEWRIAELAFPPGTTAACAKALLASELGEVCLTPLGLAEWSVSTTEIRVNWNTGLPINFASDWIDLAPGLREQCAPLGRGGVTTALTFDPAEGWTEATARAWLADNLRLTPTARIPRQTPWTQEPAVVNRPVLARAVGGVV